MKNYTIEKIQQLNNGDFVVVLVQKGPSKKVQKMLTYSSVYIADRNPYSSDFCYPVTYLLLVDEKNIHKIK